MRLSQRFSSQAFTLIELLVVIAIITLLVAVLLPVLGRSREQARRAICASNLHQSGISLDLYAQDYRDWYIPGNWGSLAHFVLYRNLGHDDLMRSYGFHGNNDGTWDSLSCPSGSFVAQFWPPPSFWAGPLTLNYFYAGGYGQNGSGGTWNGWAYVGDSTPTPYREIPKRNMADKPSEIMLMMDLARFPGRGAIVLEYLATPDIPYFGAVPPSHPSGSDANYADGANVLFVDNHVQWRQPALAVNRFSSYYTMLAF